MFFTISSSPTRGSTAVFLVINCTLVSLSRSFHVAYILFFICFLLLAFVSGHHHSHHPVSVGGSSFPMSTIFTHTITLTAPPCTHETTLWLSKQTFTFAYITLTCNIQLVVQFIKSVTYTHRWNKTVMEDYWSPLKAMTFQKTSSACVLKMKCLTAGGGPPG